MTSLPGGERRAFRGGMLLPGSVSVSGQPGTLGPGVRQSRTSRFYLEGRRMDYATGRVTMETMENSPPQIPEQVGLWLLSLIDREKIADLRRAGLPLRSIGREPGRRHQRS